VSADRLRRLLLGSRTGWPSTAAPVVRLVAGGIFLVFGMEKFTDHVSELRSFRTYGLPAPDAFVYSIGVVEIAGGVLLLLGLATRPAALMLAGDMIGAIATAGVVEGGGINLGLAPALLAAMLFLMWAGSGRVALDRPLARASLSRAP